MRSDIRRDGHEGFPADGKGSLNEDVHTSPEGRPCSEGKRLNHCFQVSFWLWQVSGKGGEDHGYG